MLKQQQPFIALVLACFVSAGRADTLYEGALIYSMDARAAPQWAVRWIQWPLN